MTHPRNNVIGMCHVFIKDHSLFTHPPAPFPQAAIIENGNFMREGEKIPGGGRDEGPSTSWRTSPRPQPEESRSMNQAGGGDQRGGGFLKLYSIDMKNSEINFGVFHVIHILIC